MTIHVTGNEFLLVALIEQLKKEHSFSILGDNKFTGSLWIDTYQGIIWSAKKSNASIKSYYLPTDYQTVINSIKDNLLVFKEGDYVRSGNLAMGIVGKEAKEWTWSLDFVNNRKNQLDDRLRLMNEKEIKKFLIKWAEWLGIEIGKSYSFNLNELEEAKIYTLYNIKRFDYDKEEDALFVFPEKDNYLSGTENRWCIYRKGEWIIKNLREHKKPMLTFGGEDVEIHKDWIKTHGYDIYNSKILELWEAMKTIRDFNVGGYHILKSDGTRPFTDDESREFRIGCTSGTFGEFKKIVEEIEKMDKK